jgi:hypothetical protein
MITRNRYDTSIVALVRSTEPRRSFVRVGAERPSPLRAVDYFLLAFTAAAGFVLGRHLRWERTR